MIKNLARVAAAALFIFSAAHASPAELIPGLPITPAVAERMAHNAACDAAVQPIISAAKARISEAIQQGNEGEVLSAGCDISRAKDAAWKCTHDDEPRADIYAIQMQTYLYVRKSFPSRFDCGPPTP